MVANRGDPEDLLLTINTFIGADRRFEGRSRAGEVGKQDRAPCPFVGRSGHSITNGGIGGAGGVDVTREVLRRRLGVTLFLACAAQESALC